MLVHQMRPPSDAGCDISKDLASDSCMRIQHVVRAQRSRDGWYVDRSSDPLEVKEMDTRAQSAESFAGRPDIGNNESDFISVPHQAARDVQSHRLSAANAGVKQAEEHSHRYGRGWRQTATYSVASGVHGSMTKSSGIASSVGRVLSSDRETSRVSGRIQAARRSPSMSARWAIAWLLDCFRRCPRRSTDANRDPKIDRKDSTSNSCK